MSKFHKAAEKLVEGYKKIEEGVVTGYKKVEDKFVGTFLTKDGACVEEAKNRLADVQQARQEQMKADAEKREADRKARIEASLKISRNAGKRN